MKFLQNAGSYRHPITLQSQSTTRNEYGEKVSTWIDVITVKAGIYPISGKDYVSAVQTNSEITHNIKLRYIPNVTANMRVKFGSRIFTIIAVLNHQERDRELQLVCKEFL